MNTYMYKLNIVMIYQRILFYKMSTVTMFRNYWENISKHVYFYYTVLSDSETHYVLTIAVHI